jgi:hypothetical protein
MAHTGLRCGDAVDLLDQARDVADRRQRFTGLAASADLKGVFSAYSAVASSASKVDSTTSKSALLRDAITAAAYTTLLPQRTHATVDAIAAAIPCRNPPAASHRGHSPHDGRQLTTG